MLASCDFDSTLRQKFGLQVLQLILPRLEQSYANDISNATILAQLGRLILQKPRSTSADLDMTNEKFGQLFRIGLAGIQAPSAPVILRESLSQTCHQYLYGIIRVADASSARRYALQNVISMGDRLFEILCDDAYGGEGTHRTSALLLLEAFVALANQEKSKYVVEALTRLNFIHVIVNNIKDIPSELQGTDGSGE